MEVTFETSHSDVCPLQIPRCGHDCAIALGNRKTKKMPTLNVRKLLLDKKEQRTAVAKMALCIIMLHTANITVAVCNKCLFIVISDRKRPMHMRSFERKCVDGENCCGHSSKLNKVNGGLSVFVLAVCILSLCEAIASIQVCLCVCLRGLSSIGLRVRSSSSVVSAVGNSAACLSAACLAAGGCSRGDAVVSACMLSMVFDGCTAGVGDIRNNGWPMKIL